jgi:hypothetical protein
LRTWLIDNGDRVIFFILATDANVGYSLPMRVRDNGYQVVFFILAVDTDAWTRHYFRNALTSLKY